MPLEELTKYLLGYSNATAKRIVLLECITLGLTAWVDYAQLEETINVCFNDQYHDALSLHGVTQFSQRYLNATVLHVTQNKDSRVELAAWYHTYLASSINYDSLKSLRESQRMGLGAAL